MPIYEYECASCGSHFERLQSFSDKTIPSCPHGHTGSVRRRLSRPAVVFKGSGWYITDSRKSSSTDKENTQAAA